MRRSRRRRICPARRALINWITEVHRQFPFIDEKNSEVIVIEKQRKIRKDFAVLILQSLRRLDTHPTQVNLSLWWRGCYLRNASRHQVCRYPQEQNGGENACQLHRRMLPQLHVVFCYFQALSIYFRRLLSIRIVSQLARNNSRSRIGSPRVCSPQRNQYAHHK